MQRLLGRLSGFLPAVVAGLLPIVFIPTASDTYILPRASLVIAGACLGVGLALVTQDGPRLGPLRWPLLAAAAAALLAFAFSISWPLSLAGSYTRYESLPMRLSYLGLLVSAGGVLRGERHPDRLGAGVVFCAGVGAPGGGAPWGRDVGVPPAGHPGHRHLPA